MINKQLSISEIISIEWDMFQQVQNIGGRAECQDDPETFQIILAVSKDKYDIFALKELLPLGFGPANLA